MTPRCERQRCTDGIHMEGLDVADQRDRGRAARSLRGMPTLVRDPQPVEFEQLLERRRALGQGLLDEVWEGLYVMNPTRRKGMRSRPGARRAARTGGARNRSLAADEHLHPGGAG